MLPGSQAKTRMRPRRCLQALAARSLAPGVSAPSLARCSPTASAASPRSWAIVSSKVASPSSSAAASQIDR
eukprot:scaffold76221_cov36-Phaeocystis_antarctica.AAC.1